MRLDLLQAVFDLSADGMCVVDRGSMRYLAMNPAYCRILGCSREEAMACSPSDFLPGLTAQTLAGAYDRLIEDAPRTHSQETLCRQQDGSMIWIAMTRQAVRSDGDWMIAITVRDLTERKEAQAGLDRFRKALDASAHGIALIDHATMAYVDINETACRMFGYRRQAFLRMPPHAMSGMPAAALEEHYHKVISESPRVRVANADILRADGTLLACELSYQALRSQGSWLIAVTATDIGARKGAQIGLERFRKALDMSAEAITLVDRASMRFVDVNQTACRMLGYPRRDYLTRNPHDQTHYTRAELEALYDEVIAHSPHVLTEEATTGRANGSRFPSESARQAIRSGDQWIIVITVRDLTLQREIEEQLRGKVEDLVRSNQELEHFAYVASHDLQEPLRMIGSYTQLLARRYAGNLDQDGREFAGFIVGGVTRMQQLIQDLLAYSRAGRIGNAFKPVSLEQVLADALLNLKGAIEREEAVIVHEPLPEVMGEASFLTQLFQNLIGNAIKFQTAAAPQVRISVRRAGQEWVISVADNGIGIGRQYFERVFVIFQRLHPREKYEGTGVGLAICRKVVERHGGRIWIESGTQAGQGTTFNFTIPVIKAQSAGSPAG